MNTLWWLLTEKEREVNRHHHFMPISYIKKLGMLGMVLYPLVLKPVCEYVWMGCVCVERKGPGHKVLHVSCNCHGLWVLNSRFLLTPFLQLHWSVIPIWYCCEIRGFICSQSKDELSLRFSVSGDVRQHCTLPFVKQSWWLSSLNSEKDINELLKLYLNVVCATFSA